MSDQPVFIKIRVEVSGPDGMAHSQVNVDRDLVNVVPLLVGPERFLLGEGLVPLEAAVTEYLRRTR